MKGKILVLTLLVVAAKAGDIGESPEGLDSLQDVRTDQFDVEPRIHSGSSPSNKGLIECGRRSLIRSYPWPGTSPLNFMITNDDRIIGGTEATKNSWPWMALLGILNKGRLTWFCGGSLINEKWVLTAAHCIVLDINIVRLGEHDINNHEDSSVLPQDFFVETALWFPGYQKIHKIHDLALVKLSFEGHLPPRFRPICLPSGGVYDGRYTGKDATVVGWGARKFGGEMSSKLRQVDITIYDIDKCRKAYSTDEYSYRRSWPRGMKSHTTLCAGQSQPVGDSCQGDSGGPLMVGDHGKFTIVGLVSNGHECGKKDYPSIYAPIFADRYLKWIKATAFGNIIRTENNLNPNNFKNNNNNFKTNSNINFTTNRNNNNCKTTADAVSSLKQILLMKLEEMASSLSTTNKNPICEASLKTINSVKKKLLKQLEKMSSNQDLADSNSHDEDSPLEQNLQMKHEEMTSNLAATIKTALQGNCRLPFAFIAGGCLIREPSQPMTWSKARLFCQERGADLAVFKDVNAFKAIQLYIKQLDSKTYWIGGTDLLEEDRWLWIDGDAMPRGPPYWGMYNGLLSYYNEPSGGTKQNCAALHAKDKFLIHDAVCSTQWRPLCQYFPSA